LIADRLTKNQRFQEAQRWFHFIFDPTARSNDEGPERYWVTKPLADLYRPDASGRRSIDYKTTDLFDGLAKTETLSAEDDALLKTFLKLLDVWEANPFKPHLIARWRTSAYAKTVVMKYLDNLIAWGDQLFRRDTMESLNEAAQLYVLAAEILGPRPTALPERAEAEALTFAGIDEKSDSWCIPVPVSRWIPPNSGNGEDGSRTLPDNSTMCYFCFPANDKLLGHWDQVADRLFKIRHCMNIEGIVRKLPLFAPPIDPALLVRATHYGLDLDSVLNDLSAPAPHYRFHVMVQKAGELCNELKGLGGTLLAVLEKRDAEGLALLRATQETEVLKRTQDVREAQIEDAEKQLHILSAAREQSETKYEFYQARLGEDQVDIADAPESKKETPQQTSTPGWLKQSEALTVSRDGIKMTAYEEQQLGHLETVADLQVAINILNGIASVFHALPIWNIGTVTQKQWGMPFLGHATTSAAAVVKAIADEYSHKANRAKLMGTYAMREHEWRLQSTHAAKEIYHTDQQIISALIRKEIAETELRNHRKQVVEAKKVEETLRDKFTNKELYNWMLGQISTVYFQAYQLAYDVAKKAEKAFQHELGITDTNYIQFGYWDSLKKGLLAGERLAHDIRRMEIAYLDRNPREPELRADYSLVLNAPLALLELKQTGSCVVEIPESRYDIDTQQGHYMRRIRSVAVSIPCVTGPHTGVHCTLSLLRSETRRTNTLLAGQYARDRENDDPRFQDSYGGIESIVTSHGQEDSGLFEPNLHDERYLPFEGAGAISTWRIELPAEFRPFDYDSISDVILHIRYTAKLGGGLLKQQCLTELKDLVAEYSDAQEDTGLMRLFSARHEFATEWHRFLNPKGQDCNHLSLDLNEDRFPYLFRGREKQITDIEVLVAVTEDARNTHNEHTLQINLARSTDTVVDCSSPPGESLSGVEWHGMLKYTGTNISGVLGKWVLTVNRDNKSLDPKALTDVYLLCHYTVD
jgi:hypothetical protein